MKGYHRAGNAMLKTKDLKAGIALVEKGLAHGPGNADLLAVLDQVFFVLFPRGSCCCSWCCCWLLSLLFGSIYNSISNTFSGVRVCMWRGLGVCEVSACERYVGEVV